MHPLTGYRGHCSSFVSICQGPFSRIEELTVRNYSYVCNCKRANNFYLFTLGTLLAPLLLFKELGGVWEELRPLVMREVQRSNSGCSKDFGYLRRTSSQFPICQGGRGWEKENLK